jgi:uncharacterized protein
MRIAVLSDIHDRLDHLELVLASVAERACDRMFFLGDLCAPFSLQALASGFSGPIDCVFGNNDADLLLFHRVAQQHPHLSFHGPVGELECAGKKVLLNHYPEIARRLAKSGEADAVFSGHDHRAAVHHHGDCLWGNPGEIMGRFGSVTWGLYQPLEHTFDIIRVA